MTKILAICIASLSFTSVASAQETATKSTKFVAPAGAQCAKATYIRSDGAIVTRNVCVVKGK